MHTQPQSQQRGLIGPIMMVLVGTIFLIGRFVPYWGFEELWPLLLIGGGIAAMFDRR